MRHFREKRRGKRRPESKGGSPGGEKRKKKGGNNLGKLQKYGNDERRSNGGWVCDSYKRGPDGMRQVRFDLLGKKREGNTPPHLEEVRGREGKEG